MNTGGRAIIQVAEKEESDAFWGFLGGKAEYPAFSKGCVFALFLVKFIPSIRLGYQRDLC